MDGREGMPLSGSASFYLLNRGGNGSGSGSGSGGGSGAQTDLTTPPVFNSLSNPNISVQSNVRDSYGNSIFQVENPSPNLPHGSITMAVVSGSSTSDPGKKKRGRPRKYGPEGANMSLALSPLSSTPSPGSMSLIPKRRGRPPGSGKKQQLAHLGEWMNTSAGLAFTPHVIHIEVGEDIAAKILLFAQQRPRALCILSANGTVSMVALRQPTSSGGTVTYEGRFEIICLSGSYLLDDSGGPRGRTGGLSISVCKPDGHIIGGAIGGRLIAASLVQVVLGSFVYGGNKSKNTPEVGPAKTDNNAAGQASEKPSTPPSPPPNSSTGGWPQGSQPDLRNPHQDFDLTRG